MYTVLKRILITSLRSNTSLPKIYSKYSHSSSAGKSPLINQIKRKMSAENMVKPKIVFVLGAPGNLHTSI